MRARAILLVVSACSGDGATTDVIPDAAAADATVADPDGAMPVEVDPEWPADTPLPAAFDFPPYLNLLDATTVVVSWRTGAATTGVVRFGTTEAYGSEAASTTAANLHHVTLANLAPATAYYYEVAIDGTSAVRPGVFVTPGRTKWRLLHSGEYHAPSEVSGVAEFADSIRAFRPHVLAESGDMVDIGDDLTHWRSYLRTAAPWISNVLLLPAHSNHVNGSGGNDNLMNLFVLPNNERWYTTRYGQVELVTLDSTYDDNSDVMTAEVPWLASTTQAAHDGTDDPTFFIALWHYPACSSQYQSRSSSRLWIQSNFVATMKANGGVDMILAAHDKYYERSTITGGIPHLITNIGNISPSAPGSNHPDCTPVKTIRDTRSTALFTIDGNRIDGKVIDENGVEIDSVSITK